MNAVVKSSPSVESQVEDDLEAMIDEWEQDAIKDAAAAADARETATHESIGDPREGEHPFTEAEKHLREQITFIADRKPMEFFELSKTLDTKKDFRGVPETKGTPFNVTQILQNDERTCGALSMDLFTGAIMLTRGIKLNTTAVANIHCKKDGRALSDGDVATLDTWLGAPKRNGGWGIQPTKSNLENAVRNAALMNARNPIYEAFTAEKWDGVERVDTCFSRYLKLNPKLDVFNCAVSRMHLLAMTVRFNEPGHKYDSVPVLQETKGGAQKSEFWATLAMGYIGVLSEPNHILDGKILQEQTRGTLIVELPELSAITGPRADNNTVKAKITLRSDKARAAYAKFVENLERGWIFGGSMNPGQYLVMPDRRFLPLEIGCSRHDPIDLEGLRKEMPQLLAELLHIYRQMRIDQPHGDLPLCLPKEADEIADTLRKKATIETAEDAIQGWLLGWLSQPHSGKFSAHEIDGVTYRDRFCLKEAFDAYNAEGGADVRKPYTDRDAKAWGKICDAADMISKGGKSRFPAYGTQTAYMVDRDLLAAELGADAQDIRDAEAFHQARADADAAARKQRGSAPKGAPVSVFEEPETAPAPVTKPATNVVPMSRTMEQILDEDCTW